MLLTTDKDTGDEQLGCLVSVPIIFGLKRGF